MGLDIGEKTVGIALADELRMSAHPLTTLSRKGTRGDALELMKLIEQHQVSDLIVGWPLELSGREGPATRRVQALVDALTPLLPPGLEIHRWDERFSTAAVERVLIEADLSRQKRKRVIDQQAAVFILQGWLDAHRRKQYSE
jgi:putative Holliday junction resolvase